MVDATDYEQLRGENTKLHFALWTLIRQNGGKVQIDMSDLVVRGLQPGVLITNPPSPGSLSMTMEALPRGMAAPNDQMASFDEVKRRDNGVLRDLSKR